MKSKHWHRCAICGYINAGRRTPDSICQRQSCRQSTFVLCPECRNPLVGRQFRCPKCRNQFTWQHCEPLQYDPATGNSFACPNDRRIENLEPAYARTLIAEHKKQGDLVIRELSQLSQSIFAVLTQFPGTLHLPDVTSVNLRHHKPITASKLTGLYLDGATRIPEEALESLASLPAELSLCGLTHLSKDAAVLVSKRRFPTLLHGVTEIDDDAAEILAKSQGVIQLDWLPEEQCPATLRARFYNREFQRFQQTIQSISPTVARELRRQSTGHSLNLAGITELRPIAAIELTGAHDLLLDGLLQIDDEVAAALGEHSGLLSLDGLRSIGPNIIDRLIRKPSKISLRSVKNFPLEALSALHSRKKVTLRLYALRKLTAEQTRRLSHLPIHIELDSGACLTIDVVQEFCQKPARLTIRKPETVSDDVRNFIIKSQCSNIQIDITTELQRKLAALASRPAPSTALQQIRLDSQVVFSDADTEHVDRFPGRLRIVFSGSVQLDRQAAKRFSHWSCDLTFLSLGHLENDVLSLLLTHSGHTIFDGIELTDDQADLISREKERGRLELPSYLNDLSTRQIEVLTGNPRVIVS